MHGVGGQTVGAKPRVEDVCAVIVTYHPSDDLPERVARTAQQVGHIIIVDNDSAPSAATMLRDVSSQENAHLIFNERNIGLAAALNQGTRRALDQGYPWILFLDQDSTPEPKMVDKLTAAHVSHPGNDTVGIVVPVTVDERSGRAELEELCDGRESVELVAAVTSGSLVASHVFASIGAFREDLFIDYVDVEYCLRLRKAGYSIILACNARLLHNLGAPTYHRFLWKSRVVTSNHSPLRRYYITRNRLLLMKEYALQEPSWTVEELQAFLKEAVKMMIFETDRKRKAGFFLRGVVDALLDRTGEFPGKHNIREDPSKPASSSK